MCRTRAIPLRHEESACLSIMHREKDIDQLLVVAMDPLGGEMRRCFEHKCAVC